MKSRWEYTLMNMHRESLLKERDRHADA